MTNNVRKRKAKRIEKVGKFNEEYVYDIAMKNQDIPYFFGGNILLHNSAYFSVYEAFKDKFESGKATMSKEEAIALYDDISDQTNKTFPEFMDNSFNTGLENGAIIKAGRENLADYSLFIIKKRYVMNLFEKDGHRLDINNKKGKLKIMGIEIKRSDTPKDIQNILTKSVEIVLGGGTANEMLKVLKDFKNEYVKTSAWTLGRPSAANAIGYYTKQLDDFEKGKAPKPRVSGAVMASINWNKLVDYNKDIHSSKIEDGSKVITCKLKKNDFGITSIAYVSGQTKFPDWFKELPFDVDLMIQNILYKKVENIFHVLGWDLNFIKTNEQYDEVFDKVSIDSVDLDDLF